jgi:hypothetical protein
MKGILNVLVANFEESTPSQKSAPPAHSLMPHFQLNQFTTAFLPHVPAARKGEMQCRVDQSRSDFKLGGSRMNIPPQRFRKRYTEKTTLPITQTNSLDCFPRLVKRYPARSHLPAKTPSLEYSCAIWPQLRSEREVLQHRALEERPRSETDEPEMARQRHHNQQDVEQI